jgi:hypothetical protein
VGFLSVSEFLSSGQVKPSVRCENIFLSFLDAESFDKSAIASCTVVINCAGKMMVEFFSTVGKDTSPLTRFLLVILMIVKEASSRSLLLHRAA